MMSGAGLTICYGAASKKLVILRKSFEVMLSSKVW